MGDRTVEPAVGRAVGLAVSRRPAQRLVRAANNRCLHRS